MHLPWGLFLSVDDAVWALASICDACRVPFDAALFLERHPPRPDGYRLAELLLAAEALGLRHARLPARSGIGPATALPVLAFPPPPAGAACSVENPARRTTPIVITSVGGREDVAPHAAIPQQLRHEPRETERPSRDFTAAVFIAHRRRRRCEGAERSCEARRQLGPSARRWPLRPRSQEAHLVAIAAAAGALTASR